MTRDEVWELEISFHNGNIFRLLVTQCDAERIAKEWEDCNQTEFDGDNLRKQVRRIDGWRDNYERTRSFITFTFEDIVAVSAGDMLFKVES